MKSFVFAILVLLQPWAMAQITSEEVLSEINFARTNPARYAEMLVKYSAETRSIGSASAVREAATELRAASPLPPLRLSTALTAAAEDHARDSQRSGKVGHHGTDGSSPTDRIRRHLRVPGASGENVCYGQPTARAIVAALIVDDGIASRGHRRNLLNAGFASVGIATGPHPRYRTMCVMDFASAHAN